MRHVVSGAAAIFLGGTLIGYLWGRRTGLDQGEGLGRAAAALELRERALAGARCPVCGASPCTAGAVDAGVPENPV